MKFTITSRGGGKTTKLVRALVGDPKAIMLVHSAQERRRITDEFRLTRLEEARIYTLDEIRDLRGRILRVDKLLVDNLDLLLLKLLRLSPAVPDPKELWISATGEMRQPRKKS